MSASEHPRLPLVLSARPRAVSEAKRLGFRGVIENEVGKAIAAGDMRRKRATGRGQVFLVAHGLIVVVEQQESASGRKAWRPLEVRSRGRGT